MTHLYKVVTATQWREAVERGVFHGAPVDVRDGYIHFSKAEQLSCTLEKHFAGQRDLLLVIVEGDSLGDGLKWEPSRGGQLFPHLYGALSVSQALAVVRLA